MVKGNNQQTFVDVRDISKVYKSQKNFWDYFRSSKREENNDKYALKNVTLQLKAGECLGLLGPNGAGKSTLVKTICGLQKADCGKVQVLGYSPSHRNYDFLRRIGVVFGHKSSLWWDLPVKDSYTVLQKIYDIDRKNFTLKLEELTQALGLSSILNRRVRNLSLGERVKCEVVAALIHDPDLLILDEPTVGLDILSKYELRKYLYSLVKQQNKGVIITSHDMADIEHCASRIVLLKEGTIIFDGSVHSVSEKVGSFVTSSLVVQEHLFSDDFIEQVKAAVDQLSIQGEIISKTMTQSKMEWLIDANIKDKMFECLQKLIIDQPNIAIQFSPPSLEDIYLKQFKDGDK
ncbi:ATP-binding cassette domain-containing protein [Bartonella machadoae]|uniref:ATP-binding cassette domain-containing protein n=1 Tax=Bartonella machadoae TaxID=2893471 RepID=UPI001F4CF779|nr:ATP-binding cassette domain-containing protein [Bartonella machadoae]UNE54913.1 ATP-binding cassette domain-containing protein [Bartonella machadoae]